jgi:hypothetical protein
MWHFEWDFTGIWEWFAGRFISAQLAISDAEALSKRIENASLDRAAEDLGANN